GKRSALPRSLGWFLASLQRVDETGLMIERLAAVANVAVRHAGAYTDLIMSDLQSMWNELISRVWAGIILAAALLLTAMLGCSWIIAISWNTDRRDTVIAILVALFLGIAALAYRRLRSLAGSFPLALSRAARAWEQDRLLLEDVLSRRPTDAS
ncbi:MAG: hypothetical protein WA814_05395, partial [Candidatus Baltobacteraceae bacterium]